MSKLQSPQLPKYWQIVEEIRGQIESGALKPGDRLPSLTEMRSGQGMSRGTVDKAHSILIAEDLIVRQPGLGTFVLDPKKVQSKGIIGISGFGFRVGGSSPYWTRLLEGIHKQAAVMGSLVLTLLDEPGDGLEKVDGVVILGTADGYISSFLQLPMVCLLSNQEGVATVTVDEQAGARQATEHLLALGHERIAFLHGQNPVRVLPRLKGYKNALREAGIAPQKNWMRSLSGENSFGAQFSASGRSGMTAWLSETGPDGWKQIGCTALLCHNDDTAIGAMQALNDAGLRVPNDVSVVGYDGTEVGEYSSPQLTSVGMPLQRMGELAIELLQKQIETNEVINEQIVLNTQLRIRQSTAAPRVL